MALPGDVLVGQGLALQADGKLLLAGSIGGGTTAELALMRLNADGTADGTFGNAGLVTTSVSGQGR